jgi:hypothetical protein
MASSKLLLSILQTEYETPAVGEWVTSRQSDMKDGTEARHTTREELDRRSLHIGMTDLLLKAVSRIVGFRELPWQDCNRRENWHGIIYTPGVSIL